MCKSKDITKDLQTSFQYMLLEETLILNSLVQSQRVAEIGTSYRYYTYSTKETFCQDLLENLNKMFLEHWKSSMSH